MRDLLGRKLFVAVLTSLTLTTQADVIYRETLGRPENTGDLATTVVGWQDFLSSGAANAAPGTAGLNGTQDSRPLGLENVNAGPNSDGSFGAMARGIHFYLAGTGSPVLSFTPEFSLDPTVYTPGSIVFSWYEGNAQVADTMRLAVRIGSQWYAHSVAHSTAAMGLGAFTASAEQKLVTYDPTAANWLLINFDGSYDGGNPGTSTASTVPLSLGAAPGANLSGTINAFGLYIEGSAGTRRWDTFQIDASPIPEPTVVALFGLGLAGLLLRRKSNS